MHIVRNRGCIQEHIVSVVQHIWILVLALLLSPVAALPVGAEEAKQQFATLGKCTLDSGKTLTDCRLGYRTYGVMNADKSNVVVVPTWYPGQSGDLARFGYIGPGLIVDTDQYFVVEIDALGNGVSSSPSNSTSQAGSAFPAFGIGDMVQVQHRLLTEKLGITHVSTVMGLSMGGMQALEWWARYPQFMNNVISISGTPWPAPQDRLLWGSWLAAARIYDGAPGSLQLAANIIYRFEVLSLWSPRYLDEMLADKDLDEFLDGFIPDMTLAQLIDRVSQTRAMLNHDIRPAWEARDPSKTAAPVLVISIKQDHMVSPMPSIEFAGQAGAELLLLDSPCGHVGTGPECVGDQIRQKVHQFQQSK